VVNEQGEVLEGEAEGILVLARSWPGQMRTLYNNHERFMEAYFTTFPGKYFTGDGVKRDADGYYWITGRVDDVLNISGHRLGTAEIESALVLQTNQYMTSGGKQWSFPEIFGEDKFMVMLGGLHIEIGCVELHGRSSPRILMA
jgi:hypothetical protein